MRQHKIDILKEAHPPWGTVPPTIIHQLESLLQGKIILGDIAYGGYSAAADFIVTVNSGKKYFIKGAHPDDDSHATEHIRQEIKAYQVPTIQQVSPSYHGFVTDGDEDGWSLAVFDYIEPITDGSDTTDRIFAALKAVHTVTSSDLPQVTDKNFVQNFLKPEGGWLRIAAEQKIRDKFLTLFPSVDIGEKFLNQRLDFLCAEQKNVASMAGPIGILHQDLRPDNILVTNDRVYLIDWPNACVGPVALDVAQLLPAMMLESKYSFKELLSRYQTTTGILLDQRDLILALVTHSGYLADRAYRAVPPKLPRLRDLQKKLLFKTLAALDELLS